MQTIVELPEFLKQAKTLLSDDEKTSVISYLAAHPKAGDLIKGTGGVRKLRWATGNKGKSGSVRVIYYYYNKTIPLFLLTAFAKNEKDNLSPAERNELAKLTTLIVQYYGNYHE